MSQYDEVIFAIKNPATVQNIEKRVSICPGFRVGLWALRWGMVKQTLDPRGQIRDSDSEKTRESPSS